MRKLDTEVLVIGGGATGTGVVRDLPCVVSDHSRGER
jgi:glycerol-3-phosphate dehydrogenase